MLPGCIVLFRTPSARQLLLCTANCAWGFFLFSFQVHEKSVLLPLVPSTLLLYGPFDRSWIGFINIVAAHSLWPLLKKDGLYVQYFVFTAFWIWAGQFWHLREGSSLWQRFSRTIQICTYILIGALHAAEPFVRIQGKPDLMVVLNVLLCAPAFGLFYLLTLAELLGFKA